MDEKVILLETFPKSDEFWSILFSVPKPWLEQLLLADNIKLRKFLDTYSWDETWFIYQQATQEGVIIEERNTE